MLKVRLQRVGRKNDPAFRVVVVDSKRGPKSGDYIEMVGSHNPRTKETALKSERINHWMRVGAQVSPTVHNILVKEKVIEGKPVNVLPKKSPVVKESEGASTQEDEKGSTTPENKEIKAEEDNPDTDPPKEERGADSAGQEEIAEDTPEESGAETPETE